MSRQLLRTVNGRTCVTRYYIDGSRVGRALFWSVWHGARVIECCRTRIGPNGLTRHFTCARG